MKEKTAETKLTRPPSAKQKRGIVARLKGIFMKADVGLHWRYKATQVIMSRLYSAVFKPKSYKEVDR